MEVRVLFRAQTMNKKTIAIINDSEVTTGSLPNNIISINAWDINWDDLSLGDNYIVLGGHMGSYDDQKFTYLQKEKQWLKNAINANAKILGICLGSQLIADAMGGWWFVRYAWWTRFIWKYRSNIS